MTIRLHLVRHGRPAMDCATPAATWPLADDTLAYRVLADRPYDVGAWRRLRLPDCPTARLVRPRGGAFRRRASVRRTGHGVGGWATGNAE